MEKFESEKYIGERRPGIFRLIKNGFDGYFEYKRLERVGLDDREKAFRKNLAIVLSHASGEICVASSEDDTRKLEVVSKDNGYSVIRFENYKFQLDEDDSGKSYFKYELEIHASIQNIGTPLICGASLAAHEKTPLSDSPRIMLMESFRMSEAGSSFGGNDMGKYAAEAAALAPELRPKIEVIGIERQQ